MMESVAQGNPDAGQAFLALTRMGENAFVDRTLRYQIHHDLFGRLHAGSVDFFLKMLLDRSNNKEFIFSARGIAAFKDFNAERKNIFQTVGTAVYDKTFQATVLEIKVGGELVERDWIDPSRGYLCPLIERYNPPGGPLERKIISSDYRFDEASGLWYPMKVVSSVWLGTENRSTSPAIHEEYDFHLGSIQINRPVEANVFAINIPTDGSTISGRRIKFVILPSGQVR